MAVTYEKSFELNMTDDQAYRSLIENINNFYWIGNIASHHSGVATYKIKRNIIVLVVDIFKDEKLNKLGISIKFSNMDKIVIEFKISNLSGNRCVCEIYMSNYTFHNERISTNALFIFRMIKYIDVENLTRNISNKNE